MSEEEKQVWELGREFGVPIGRIGQSPNQFGGIKTIFGFPEKNIDYKDTDYYFNGKDLLHFTSIKALFSIINERSVRLYNLTNSNDPNEYSYASRYLSDYYRQNNSLNETEIVRRISHIKEDSFILSCTSVVNINKKFHWDKYGDEGMGVAIEFQILGDPLTWEKSYCSQVKYGNLDKIEALFNSLNRLSCIKNKFIINMDQIISFHKENQIDFISEDEIRILTERFDGEKYGIAFNALKYNDIGKDNGTAVKYIRLPLWSETGFEYTFEREVRNCRINVYEETILQDINDLLKVSPLLKINRLWFTQNRLTQKGCYQLESDLRNCFKRAFGYDLNIQYVSFSS